MAKVKIKKKIDCPAVITVKIGEDITWESTLVNWSVSFNPGECPVEGGPQFGQGNPGGKVLGPKGDYKYTVDSDETDVLDPELVVKPG